MSRQLLVFVSGEAAGERLDVFLAGLAQEADVDPALAGLSRAQLQRHIAAGRVSVDNKAQRAAYRVAPGACVRLSIPPPAPSELVPEPMPLSILYEDEHLLALDKPAGLVVHPGAGQRTGTLVHGLLAHCQDLSGVGGVERPGIVHRLDRETSGVLVVAKHDRAHEGLSRQFAQRLARKRYRAFVLGEPQPPRQRIETLHGRHPTQRLKFTTRVAQGKVAITSYETLYSAGGVTELLVSLETGRTHQIRVHLAERGHPVVGDSLYGGVEWRRIHAPAARRIAEGLGRQALHAERLEVTHPVSGEGLVLVAPLPPELARLRAALETPAD